MPSSALPARLPLLRPNMYHMEKGDRCVWAFNTKPSKVYVASSVDNQNHAIRVALRLVRAGLTVTSRWLDINFSSDSNRNPWESSTSRERNEEWGQRDIEDMTAADTLVLLANVSSSSGGYHCELGYFLGKGGNVLVVGDRRNVFYWTSRVQYLPDDSSLLEFLMHPDHGKVPESTEFGLTNLGTIFKEIK